MRGKEGSTIVTIAISLFLVLAVLSPICHSISHSEENLGVVIETPERNIDNMNLNNYPFLKKLNQCGRSLSVFGDTIVIGADHNNSVYIYERDLGGSDNWGEVTKITAAGLFGRSVSIYGDTLVVGAYYDDIGANDYQGSAYVFERNLGGADNWGQVAKLTALDGAAGDCFGVSVSVFIDTIVVGAFGDNISSNNTQGSAYVFERNEGGADNWGEVTKLTALDGAADDLFGYSVSVFGDTIVVGAVKDEVGPNHDQGSAYVYERDLGGVDNWGQVTQLTALDGVRWDTFGVSVSIFEDTIVVGAHRDNVSTNIDQGSAYVFERNEGGADNWGQVTNISAINGTAWDNFGYSVSIYCDTILVGAYHSWYMPSYDIRALPGPGSAYASNYMPSYDIRTLFRSGSAYVFKRDQGGADNWGQVTEFKSGEQNDFFGNSVSVFGDTIVVGANGSWSSWPGVAYIFKQTTDFVIPLDLGWNLISLPLIQTNTSITNVLSSINGTWDYIQAYNATDLDHWDTNAIFKPDQLNDLKKLNHKMGFWIHITEPGVNLTVMGNESISTSIPLYAGWNLVGYPTMSTEIVANALWGTGADRVEVFDPAEPYRVREVGPSYVMKPGEGYWVHVVADTTWVINW